MNLDPHTHLLLLREQPDRAGRPGRRHAVVVRRDPLVRRLRQFLRRRDLARGPALVVLPSHAEPAPSDDHPVVEDPHDVLIH